MKIYYNSSLWNDKKGLLGLPQRIHWQFEYAGTKRYIPYVYRFSKGIVFDIITILDEMKLREFFERYEKIEEILTPLQRRCAEQEHPYQSVPIKEIWVNGKKVEVGYSSSSTISIPWVHQNDELVSIRKAYSFILKDAACFACERFCVPYPEADSKVEKLLRFLRLDPIRRIKVSTYPIKRLLPLDIHFEILQGEKEKIISFHHPITGIKHNLYFQKLEWIEIPMGTDRTPNFHIMQSMYEIEPTLPQGDTLQFNSSIQYKESPKEQKEDYFSPNVVSSIGIIGGADGPTALSISSKEKDKIYGLHHLPLHSCISVPSIQKEDIAHFIVEGINTRKYGSQEYIFRYKK